jgi:hypothetical protein
MRTPSARLAEGFWVVLNSGKGWGRRLLALFSFDDNDHLSSTATMPTTAPAYNRLQLLIANPSNMM